MFFADVKSDTLVLDSGRGTKETYVRDDSRAAEQAKESVKDALAQREAQREAQRKAREEAEHRKRLAEQNAIADRTRQLENQAPTLIMDWYNTRERAHAKKAKERAHAAKEANAKADEAERNGTKGRFWRKNPMQYHFNQQVSDCSLRKHMKSVDRLLHTKLGKRGRPLNGRGQAKVEYSGCYIPRESGGDSACSRDHPTFTGSVNLYFEFRSVAKNALAPPLGVAGQWKLVPSRPSQSGDFKETCSDVNSDVKGRCKYRCY